MSAGALVLGSCLALSACGGSDEVAALTAPEPPGPPTPFSVMTFNVLCSLCQKPEHESWSKRLAYFEDIFARYEPDLIGLQELTLQVDVDQILALRPGFAAAFHNPPEARVPYPDAAVLYRESRFEKLSEGDYWLSPTPDKPNSTGFAKRQIPRLVYWVELRDRESRRSLYFASTHFDNNSPSQEMSAPLVLERTTPWTQKMPVILVGDFNSQADDEAFQLLTTGANGFPPLYDTQPLASVWEVRHNQATAPAYALEDRIDYIFVSPNPATWHVERWDVDLYTYGASELYPSDHFAMVARVTPPAMDAP